MLSLLAPTGLGVGVLLSWLTYSILSTSCRCRPWEPCWPSGDLWQTLNSSIDGNLFHLRPVAHVCYKNDTGFNRGACDNLLHHLRDSGWRASLYNTEYSIIGRLDTPNLLQSTYTSSTRHLNFISTCCLTVPPLGLAVTAAGLIDQTEIIHTSCLSA